jgi:hypothetical protein
MAISIKEFFPRLVLSFVEVYEMIKYAGKIQENEKCGSGEFRISAKYHS